MDYKNKHIKILAIKGMIATIQAPSEIAKECLIYELNDDAVKEFKKLKVN